MCGGLESVTWEGKYILEGIGRKSLIKNAVIGIHFCPRDLAGMFQPFAEQQGPKMGIVKEPSYMRAGHYIGQGHKDR
jgi:hypothetical protein